MTEIPPQSQPESWSELLAGYVLGDLTPAEIAMVDRYLAEHPEQQAEVENLMLTVNLLPLTLPAEYPPPTLKQQIMEIAQSEAVVVHNNTSIDRSKSESLTVKWWQPIVAGIGLSILGILGWQNYQLSHELAVTKQDLSNMKVAFDRQTNSPQAKLRQRTSQKYQSVVNLIQQTDNRFFSLKSTGEKSVRMGSLIVAPQQSSAVLTLQQVSPVPPSQVYRIWAMSGDEETACGDFIPDAEGKVLMELPFKGWQKITKVMITIEEKTAVEPEGEIAIES